MATRMQQRRGTAAQWISTNSGNGPILAAGEIGYESDTNKFKIGDGTNHWLTLDYFMDADSTVNPQFGSSIAFEGATANAFETTLAVTDPTADRTITLPNASGTIALMSDILDVIGTAGGALNTLGELSDAINDDASYAATITTALGTKLSKSDGGSMQANIEMGTNKITGLGTPTLTTDATNKTYVDTAITTAVGSYLPLAGGTLTGSLIFEGTTADAHETTLIVTDPTADRTIYLPNVDGTIITTGNLSDITNAGVFAGSIIFEGTTANEFETTLSVVDPTANRTITFQDLTGTVAFAADIETHRSDTTDVHGLSDTSDIVLKSGAQTLGGAKTFTGDTVLPVNTSIGTVTSTQIGYVAGVTSAIQTQLDAKAALASPTFTGTVTLPSGTVTSGMILDGTILVGDLADGAVTSAKILDGTIVNADINATAAIDWTKLGISSTVSSTEIGYVDGVTSAIQTQLDAKAPLATPTFTGTVTSTNDMVVDGNLTVNGTTFNASSTSITIEDNLLQLAHQNVANTVDLGLVVGYNDGANKHSGIVRDVSADKWKLFKGVTSEPSTTVDFTQGSLDALQVGALEATTVTPSSGVVFSDGTQTKEGVPSQTARFEKTASYNLSTDGLSLRDGLIEINAAGGTTLTIPLNATTAFPVGTSIDVLQVGAGQVTVAGAIGVTVNSTPGLKLRTQWSSATLFKRGTDLWVLMGDLSA